MHTVVKLDTARIADWDSFHDVCAQALGFPGFYGRNMNAWIDCMTSLDEPRDGMTRVHAPKGGVLISQSTYDIIRDWVDVEPQPGIKLKGVVEPVTGYVVRSVQPEKKPA